MKVIYYKLATSMWWLDNIHIDGRTPIYALMATEILRMDSGSPTAVIITILTPPFVQNIFVA